MFKQGLALVVTGAMALGGCTTVGFAPPEVTTRQPGGASADLDCNVITTEVTPDVSGATVLTDNFLTAYRCAARQAANGRPWFEVPSFLALVAAAAGPTFGMKKRGIVASGIGAGLFGQANSYFAPREKAAILDHAIDALLCIKTEAVGVRFFDTTKPVAAAAAGTAQMTEIDDTLSMLADEIKAKLAERSRLAPGVDTNELDNQLKRLTTLVTRLTERRAELVLAASRPDVNNILIPRGNATVNVSEQYFQTVSAALLSVERVLAQRLSNAGRAFDAAGISAEIEKATKEKQAADDNTQAMIDAQRKKALGALAAAPSDNDVILVSMERLQPALQSCVTRAKM